MDKMREEFELWAENQALNTMQDGETYYFADTHHFWQAWKASRAALVVELHKLPEAFDYGNGGVYRDHVEDALDKAGIKYE